MIEMILLGLSVLLDVMVLVILVTPDSETSRLRKTVTIKQLKLNEKALDIQIENTAVMMQGSPPEEEKIDEERTPIGFARKSKPDETETPS